MSEVPSKNETGMSELGSAFSKQWNRRELGKIALAGAVGATQMGWPRSGFAQKNISSNAVGPQSPLKPGLKLSCLCPSTASDDDLVFYRQIGVDSLHVNSSNPDDYTVEGLLKIKKRFADAGHVIQIMPEPINDLMQDIVLNGPGRDKAIEKYIAWIQTLSGAGFDYIPMTFNLTRAVLSGFAPTRFSRARDFDVNAPELWEQGYNFDKSGEVRHDDHPLRTPGGVKGSAKSLLYGREYTKDEIWANYTHFIKAVVPVAEKANVRIAFHPDDPPLPSLFGVAHIFATFDDYKKAMEIANSPAIGVLLCCGTWEEGTTMGIDTEGAIRYFGSRKKIFEIHFRNVSSTLPHFNETYPDYGYYDQYKVMKALTDVKYDNYVQLDHSIPMPGGLRTYEAFSIGYMRALAQRAAIEDHV